MIFAFQFTTSQGGRPRSICIAFPISIFQFTTSQGGRLCPQEGNCTQGSFNSRPHKEVDISLCASVDVNRLSIHDLTRRSTCRISLGDSRCILSIHDLTRRSTLLNFSLLVGVSFQFTTSQGGRLGSTTMSNVFSSFNSRPHKEVDPCPIPLL